MSGFGDNYHTIGTIGVCLNGAFFCLCILRLVRSLMASHCDYRESRVQLHISMSTFAFFEFFYQITILATEKITAWGYTFHMLALNANIISYCLIFLRWERTLGLTNLKSKAEFLTKFIVSVNIVVSIPTMIIVYIRGASARYWPILFIGALVEACSLLFTTIWLFAYSVQLRERISRVVNSSVTPAANEAKQNSVQRIVYVLFTCSCTYFGRIFCLTLLGIDLMTGTSRTARFTNVGWFIFSNWIPTLVPGLLFLYTSRIIRQTAEKNKSLQDIFSRDMGHEILDEDDYDGSSRVYSNDRTMSTESFSGEMRRLQTSGASSDPPGHYRSRETSADSNASHRDLEARSPVTCENES